MRLGIELHAVLRHMLFPGSFVHLIVDEVVAYSSLKSTDFFFFLIILIILLLTSFIIMKATITMRKWF